nr:DNA repair protein REV1 isoform X2 [Hydra vulgaris]
MKRKSCNNVWEEKGGYIQMKADKLQNQFQDESIIHRKSNIFKNVSIWVNGYTYPSSDELKRLVGENGGRYQHYFSKTHVTHVIATNLTSSKIKDLKKNDQVVHPDWIVDCVSAGKLLPVDKYLLYSTNKRDGTELKFNFDAKKTPESLQSHIIVPKTGKCLSENECIPHLKNENGCIPHLKNENGCIPHLSKHDYSVNETKKLPCKAGDPNFISEYYSHSRLHHLSMWKAELKKFTIDIQKKRKQFNNEIVGKKFNRLIMHVDMDSFFVSVAQTIDQSLKGKAIAVCHANKSNGSSDSYSSIASCSYEARCFGLKNGMMLNKAKSLCPNLICVPYHFDQYRKVSQKVYKILSSYTCEIEAVSCDEALLDITHIAGDVYDLAEKIRKDIFEETKCTASCGIGENILLAKLATKQAKPNGVCYIQKCDVPEFIASQKVCNLPGIGAIYSEKLSSLSILTCADLQKFSLFFLKKEFGQKLGEMLYNFCRGEDSRTLKLYEERKSVSAEINYGMRFSSMKEVEEFIDQLSKQVEVRLTEAEKKGKLITLKMMIRQKGEGNPLKYMGHGLCDNVSKSIMISSPTNSSELISRYCLQLLHLFTVIAQDIRGIGIQVTKLSDNIIQNKAVDLFKFMNHAKVLNNGNGQFIQDNVLNNSIGQVVPDVLNNSIGQVVRDVLNNSSCQVVHDANIPKTSSKVVQDSEQNASNILSSPDLFEPTSFILESPNIKNQSECDSWNLSVLNQLPIDIQEELQLQCRTKNSSKIYHHGEFHEKILDQKLSSKIITSPSKKAQTKKYNQMSPDKKRRRGRPKTVISLLDSSKFRDIKTSLKINKSSFLTPANVDINILNELPEEIRNEILAELKNTKFISKEKKVVQSEIQNNKISHGKKQFLNQISFLPLQKPSVTTPISAAPLNIATSSATLVKLTAPPKIVNSSVPLQTSLVYEQLPQVSFTFQTPLVALPSQKNFNDVLLSPSQINKSFMEALPEDIQSELLLEIKNAKKKNLMDVKPKENETILGFKETRVNFNNVNLDCNNANVDCNTPLISNKKLLNHKEKNFDVLSPSQLDISVFNELPVELQREVMMVARSNKNRTIRHSERQKLLNNDQAIIKKDQNTIEKDFKLTQVIPVFNGLSTSSFSTSSEITKSISEIKAYLQNWILSGVEPNPKDVEAIKSYNHLLIKSRNMETLQLLLLYFKRLVSKTTTLSYWKSIFNEVLSDTQKFMKLKYNGRLNILRLSCDDYALDMHQVK